jgi:transposase
MQSQSIATPKLFIGLDVHKKSWQAHLRTDISDHKGFSLPPDPEILSNYVFKHFPDHQIELSYEAGCCGFSAAREFINLGWSVTIVNPSDIPRMDKQLYQKTDKLDCRNLAKQLQLGQLKAIYIPTESQEQLRSLLRQRDQLVKQFRKVKAHIKSLLLFHGIVIPTEFDNPNWSKNFQQWLFQLPWPNITGMQCLHSKLRVYNLLNKEILQTSNELRAYCRKIHHKDYYLLKSIPGIGGILSTAILAELGDIRRFNNERQFANCIGLVPGIHQSSETSNYMGITPRCKALLRTYLIEAAWVAIRLDPEIQQFYRKHIGKNQKTVIVKVAHKMCRRILSVIKSGIPYQIGHNC